MKFNFTEIRKKRKGEINPLIVHFQNGDVTENKPMLDVKLFPYDTPSEKSVEVSSSDGQLYTNSLVNNLPQAIRFIAIRNRKTGKVKLVEVGFTTLINSKHIADKPSAACEEKDTKKQGQNLKKVFGTKRAIRHLQRKEELNVETLDIDDQIKEIISETKINESHLSVEAEPEDISSKLIPHCNRETKNLSDVYNVEDCLTSVELSSLSEGIQKVLQHKHNLDDSFSEYFKFHLKEVLSNKENLSTRLGCLLYADSLIKYIKVPAKNLVKAASTLCPYSKEISDKIMKEFCVKTGSSYNRPLTMKDKAVCYIIVLTLLSANYKVDLELLSKATAFGYKKVKQLGRLVGVVPSKKDSKIHELQLPLPAPMKMVKTYRKKK